MLFKSTWPTLYLEKESTQTRQDPLILPSSCRFLSTLAPGLLPEEGLWTPQWAAPCFPLVLHPPKAVYPSLLAARDPDCLMLISATVAGIPAMTRLPRGTSHQPYLWGPVTALSMKGDNACEGAVCKP